jgi:hypothetical protein
MFFFAKLLENNIFEGTIIAYLVGTPFIIVIILTSRDQRTDYL